MHDIIAAAATFTGLCFAAAFFIKYRSNISMQPKTYTVLSPMGRHASVVLYPQAYGRGIDREGNEYRILDNDTAELIGND